MAKVVKESPFKAGMANIGFISTRFGGQDGVSLESAKWAKVLWDDRGHVSFWYSGRNDRHPEISHCVPEAHFGFPENEWINRRIWSRTSSDQLVTNRIHEIQLIIARAVSNNVSRLDLLSMETVEGDMMTFHCKPTRPSGSCNPDRII